MAAHGKRALALAGPLGRNGGARASALDAKTARQPEYTLASTMRTLTASLAIVLIMAGRLTLAADGLSTLPGPVRYATDAQWAACIEQVQAELARRGQCGASNCYDDAGRDLIDICIERVGYLRHSEAEARALLRELREPGISNATVSKVRTYPPGHPVRKAFARTQETR